MSTADFSLLQGYDYLNINNMMTNSILNKTKKYSSGDKQSTIEGFTTKTATENKADSEAVKLISEKYNKAVSNYSISHKQLMSEANNFINNRTSTSNNYRGKIIKMKNGKTGYITDKNIFKYIGSDTMLERLSNVCRSKVYEVDFTSEKYLDVGERLGTNPDFIVGKPMAENSFCMPTETNIQIQGHINTELLAHNWVGCYNQVGDFFDKQDDLTGKYQSNTFRTIRSCSLRAADIGASTFYIGHEPDNKYTCYTSKPGLTTEKIKAGMEPGIVKKISSVIHSATLPATASMPAVGIMNNGQIALGNIPSVIKNNFGLSVENPILWKTPGVVNCDPVYGSKIDVQGANYGANCNGKTPRIIN